MKKLKFLTLAAIAAATAMVSSCSDNDVLEGVKDTGIPFSVTASTNSGGSRGSDITTLSNFQLWGFGTDQTSHFDGNNFTPKAGSSTVFESSITPNWPNTNNCLFYGISNNTSTMAYGVTAGSPGINTTREAIRNGSFDYTIPTNVADQEDLLVAAATGNSNDGVHLKFDHALTAAKLWLSLDPTKTSPYDTYLLSQKAHEENPNEVLVPSGYIVKIKKIIIHNIKVSGTYAFNGSDTDTDGNYVNGSWNTSSGTLGDCEIDFGDNPYYVVCKIGEPYNKALNINGDDSNLYFIPQTISYWNIKPNDESGYTQANFSTPGTDSDNNVYSYVEFQEIAFDYLLSDAVTILENKVSEGNGWTKDATGYYYNTKEVAKADGFITDAAVAIDQLGDLAGETQSYDDEVETADYLLSDFNKDFYAPCYTPFKATLNVNGSRILKINLDQGVIKFNDCSALFGVSAEGGA